MKSKVIFVLVITLILNLFFWPKKEVEEKVNNVVNYPIAFNVELEGEVVFPGIYTLYANTSLRTVIEYAGGFTINANQSSINLNEIITKSRKIIVLSKEITNEPTINTLVNLNTANLKELLSVPNVTEKRAANIIIYREQYGLFKSVDELINVKYIGEVVFEKISKYFTV